MTKCIAGVRELSRDTMRTGEGCACSGNYTNGRNDKGNKSDT